MRFTVQIIHQINRAGCCYTQQWHQRNLNVQLPAFEKGGFRAINHFHGTNAPPTARPPLRRPISEMGILGTMPAFDRIEATFLFSLRSLTKGGSSMPALCKCGCGRRVSLKGMLTKPCSRKGYTSINLKRMTKEQLRRLADPDGVNEKYQTKMF